MNLRYMLAFMRILKIPGLMPIMKDLQAFLRFNFMFAAYESGLLAALSKPCSRDELIEKMKVKRPDLLDALLDMGLATKELSRDGDVFKIKGKRSKAVINPKGDMVAAVIQANVTYYSDAYRHAADRLMGGELGDDLEDIGDLVARFSKGAEPIIKNFITKIVSKKKSMRVLDIGCGSGVCLRCVHSANGNASGVGIDVDESVAKQAKINIENWGLTERFEIKHGDIRSFSDSTEGSFDLVTLNNILYYFQKHERIELIKDIRSRLSPGGMLAIVMNFDSQGKDLTAANLNMVNCSLKGLTPLPRLEEISEILLKNGFSRVEPEVFIPASTFMGLVAYV